MRKFGLLFFLSVFSLINCRHRQENIQFQKVSDYTLNFEEIESENLNLAKLAHLFLDSSCILYYYDNVKQEILMKDLLDSSFNRRIDISKVLTKTQLEDFCIPIIISKDSILFISNNNIILNDDKNSEVKALNFSAALSPNFTLNSNTFTPGVYANKSIYCIKYYNDIYLKDKHSFKEYFSRDINSVLKLYDSLAQPIYSIGEFPDKYKQNFYYEFFPSYCINNSGELVFSFGIDNNLYVFDKNNTSKVITAKSKYFKRPTVFPLKNLQSFDFIRKYQITEFRYLSLDYDPYFQRYYRIVKHHSELLEDDETIKNILDIPWSLMVLDKNLKLVREIDFDPTIYTYGKIIPTQLGLFIPKRVSPNSSEITFTLFRLY